MATDEEKGRETRGEDEERERGEDEEREGTRGGQDEGPLAGIWSLGRPACHNTMRP